MFCLADTLVRASATEHWHAPEPSTRVGIPAQPRGLHLTVRHHDPCKVRPTGRVAVRASHVAKIVYDDAMLDDPGIRDAWAPNSTACVRACWVAFDEETTHVRRGSCSWGPPRPRARHSVCPQRQRFATAAAHERITDAEH
jgi:hypothetical protein